MAAFKGRLAVNVDTMCAFGDRVSETAAAEIEFGLLGFVREGVTAQPVHRPPRADRRTRRRGPRRHRRARPGAVRRRRGLLACASTAPGRAGRRRRRARAVARGVGPVPRGRHRDDPRHHVRRRGVRRAAHRLRDRRPAGAPGPPQRRVRRHPRRRDVGGVVVARPRRRRRWTSSSTSTATRATAPPTSTRRCGARIPDLLRPILATHGVDAGDRRPGGDRPRRASPIASTPRASCSTRSRGADRDAAVRAIADARHFTVLREQVKVVSQRSLDVARAAARTLGRDLADRRCARRARRRVPPRGRRVRHRSRAPDLRARVAYRKELAAGYETFDLPVLFVGNPSSDAARATRRPPRSPPSRASG